MMYEIGYVCWFDGSATKIIGPFDTREDANEECSKRNKKDKCKMPPGRGSPGWMTAYWMEIPRGKDCTTTAPGQD